jgi:hypothetical protein
MEGTEGARRFENGTVVIGRESGAFDLDGLPFPGGTSRPIPGFLFQRVDEASRLDPHIKDAPTGAGSAPSGS